ncbi:ABC spermidine/putrescine transporter, inner membrane subunit [Oceanicola granulosus HTCC2516]|uniref:ABC spermidine/putrescine transporter, inner membrane subunit n=1 Tax=Oceanicola granulosus (strain ATCC BAA-861 / DSM 15982 / KCTC 12143 / HTCC2516) TaxID=314256 RepID=Q2CE98_OCEGH|nr:ABC transporter permease [Oceanicola granulosus]EAR50962.1 ABC spermidine/putrescine transporter, inner membrane subunit [Oceanicola granulosus HTCC2516]
MAQRFGVTREVRRSVALISVPFLYAILLLALPLGAIVLFSFWTQDFLTIDTSFTLANYREALTQPIYTQLILRSLAISATVTVATVVLAFPIAYFVSFHLPPHRKSLWLFLITIPFWTSYLIRVFLWKVILGYNGVLNTSLTGLGLIDEPLTFILYNANAVVITLAHAFAPFAILPIFVALEKIDRSLLEASRDLGESRSTTFFRVTLPLAMPGVVAAVLIVFIPTIGDYVTPRLVGGPDGLMIANMIQTQFLRLNNAPLGAALALIAMVCVTVIALGFVWLNRRWLGGDGK